MSADATARMRQSLAVRVVEALDLPDSISRDHPRLDKYRLHSDPALLRDVAALVADQLPPGTQVLAGVELGGVPLATAMALHTGLPWALIRRARESEGPRSPLSGSPVQGREVVIVKDMARAGAAISATAEVLRASGAEVTHAAVGVNWNPDLADILRPVGITLVTALDLADLRSSWRSAGRLSPATPRGLSKPEDGQYGRVRKARTILN
jgi:orotate phosphoribosyltransferase